jgi:hypothetical protein
LRRNEAARIGMDADTWVTTEKSIMKFRPWLLTLCFLLSLSLACDHGMTPSTGQDPFSFRVSVTKEAGTPKPNVRVSLCPPTGLGSLPKLIYGESPREINSSSTINFAVASAARITLLLSDLDGSPIQRLVDNELLQAGLYACTISLQRSEGAKVMKCRLVATDTASGISLFRDSIYVTLWQPDPDLAILGYTSLSGTFESRDTLLFPYILSLPPIIVTRDDPTPLGTFTFPDSCLITLTDTSSATHMTFIRHLIRGANEFKVTWNPTGMPSPGVQNGRSSLPWPVHAIPGELAALNWQLYQNYPNPFN